MGQILSQPNNSKPHPSNSAAPPTVNSLPVRTDWSANLDSQLPAPNSPDVAHPKTPNDRCAVVFRWCHSDRTKPPKEILLQGEWDPDHSTSMVADTYPLEPKELDTKSNEELVYIAIVYLHPGTYRYYFYVDGKPSLAPDQPISESRNVITVLPSESYTRFQSASITEEDDEWTQVIPDPPSTSMFFLKESKKKTSNSPVELPAHLERALLNTQPISSDPMTLPLPHHVMINHLYSKPNPYGSYTLGLTVRYRDKFITLVMYKPTESTPLNTLDTPPEHSIHPPLNGSSLGGHL